MCFLHSVEAVGTTHTFLNSVIIIIPMSIQDQLPSTHTPFAFQSLLQPLDCLFDDL